MARIKDRAPANRDMACQHKRLEARARQVRDTGGQQAVHPVAGFLACDHEPFDPRAVCAGLAGFAFNLYVFVFHFS